jgi:hypothetical protein
VPLWHLSGHALEPGTIISYVLTNANEHVIPWPCHLLPKQQTSWWPRGWSTSACEGLSEGLRSRLWQTAGKITCQWRRLTWKVKVRTAGSHPIIMSESAVWRRFGSGGDS